VFDAHGNCGKYGKEGGGARVLFCGEAARKKTFWLAAEWDGD